MGTGNQAIGEGLREGTRSANVTVGCVCGKSDMSLQRTSFRVSAWSLDWGGTSVRVERKGRDIGLVSSRSRPDGWAIPTRGWRGGEPTKQTHVQDNVPQQRHVRTRTSSASGCSW